MMEIVYGFIFGFLSSVGFGIITNNPRRTLVPAGLVGAIAWIVYIIVGWFNHGLIMPNLMGAVVIGLLGNLCAILVKAPVNIFYVPCLVSLVPGAILYDSMKNFTLGKDSLAAYGFVKALTVGMSLAIGFIIAETIANKIYGRLKQHINQKESK
ncbi:threonine/serine exporter family protein [Companilactobacillus musae]|uniref:threonine/serine exporter family protein n=1 Tax=Companilactobacillus musae TaxID=1903258 RepID=UPI001FE9D35E|nr:threonine/serine exporter family protein [Companilactobacillus musae]